MSRTISSTDASRYDAQRELDRVLARQRRLRDGARPLTLEELAREYLAQHDAQPETIANLRWLLTNGPGPRRAVGAPGHQPKLAPCLR